MSEIDVIKYNAAGVEQWRYRGTPLTRSADFIILEAFFDRADMNLNGLHLAHADRFIEIYFSNRWYNIFEIYRGSSPQLKGWYCNITAPAVLTKNSVEYVDLALDLLVFPDGKQIVLDKDEFEVLKLEKSKRQTALAALEELQGLFMQEPSFSVLKWMDLNNAKIV